MGPSETLKEALKAPEVRGLPDDVTRGFTVRREGLSRSRLKPGMDSAWPMGTEMRCSFTAVISRMLLGGTALVGGDVKRSDLLLPGKPAVTSTEPDSHTPQLPAAKTWLLFKHGRAS